MQFTVLLAQVTSLSCSPFPGLEVRNLQTLSRPNGLYRYNPETTGEFSVISLREFISKLKYRYYIDLQIYHWDNKKRHFHFD